AAQEPLLKTRNQIRDARFHGVLLVASAVVLASRVRCACLSQRSRCSARRRRYSASGVGLSAGGSTANALAVMQVIENVPVAATNATRSASPIVFSAAA